MPIIKAVAKSLLFVAAVFLVFRYFADFSLTQSWVLAVVAWLGYGLYESLRTRLQVEKDFSPFWVSVTPNWYELLRDFRIINNEEEWDQLGEKSGSVPSSEYNVLRSDIRFTVLRPQPDACLPGLIYWNSRKTFVSEVDFEEGIEEIKLDHPSFENNPRLARSPEVFIKFGAKGYELGLAVLEEWWKQTCAEDKTKEIAKTKTGTDYLTGTTRLVVATLPYSEFRRYFYQVNEKHERNTNAQLAQNGWKREEIDSELQLLGAPDEVKHKYFTVAHRAI